MKNTFKYIAALVAFSAATLASGLSMSAQNLPEDTYLEDNNIAYAKRAYVNSDGTYTINLETFVTGEVTQTFEVHPADIVLVLDVSGSMDDTITSYTYSVASHTSITAGTSGWGYGNNSKNTNYYYLYEGEYYRVTIRRSSTGGYGSQNYYYALSFTVNNTRMYINDSGQVVSNMPTNHTNANTDLWNSSVTLYTQSSSSMSKMDALKLAVKAFIDQIAHNDWYEDDTDNKRRDEALGNQISIVKFAGNRYYNYTSPNNVNPEEDPNAPITAGDNRYNDGGFSYNYTQVVKGFTTTSSDANVTNLKQAVQDLVEGGATSADYGMNLALNLINSLDPDERSDSRKTIVFFTDGEPNHSRNFDNNVATAAIKNSKKIKDISYTEPDPDHEGQTRTVHPSVFSVGLFDSTPTPNSNLNNFMNYISSNYPGATAYNNGGTQESSNYYMDASGGSADDLKKIFTAIAHSSGGTGNADLSGGSSVTVDVVSTSFSVPSGYEDHPENAITVLVAPCTGVTTIGGKQYLTFGEEKAPTEYGLPAITPSISEDDNKVSTTGFNYAENWCGPDPTSTSEIQPGYHGFKQIIRFIITVNDDAVGGPSVNTNDSESGIYLEDSEEPLLTFNRPTVKLPVQIWLQKQGLRPGDSAVFTLYMLHFDDYDPTKAYDKQDWSNFTKVVVNYNDMDANGMVKIVGLDPDYYYRLKEDAWAFGYTYQDGGVQYTIGDNVENPFIFVNEPKNLKFDEDSARNVFNERTR